MSLGLQHRTGCHRTVDLDMDISMDDTMALGGSTSHPDQHGSGSGNALKFLYDHKWQLKHWTYFVSDNMGHGWTCRSWLR